MARKDSRSAPYVQEHHKRLVELFNALTATHGKEKPENWERMVYNLLDCAIYHFRAEADIAAKSGYAETTWDTYDREMLERRVIEIRERVNSRELFSGSDLLLRLRDVLRAHLARENGPLISSGLKL